VARHSSEPKKHGLPIPGPPFVFLVNRVEVIDRVDDTVAEWIVRARAEGNGSQVVMEGGIECLKDPAGGGGEQVHGTTARPLLM
jgi:hypothetical protein